jgi:hypothetical protein
MSGRERRLSPRKVCAVPLRFQTTANGHAAQARDTAGAYETRTQNTKASTLSATLEGEAQNLSERGIYFLTPERLSVGEPLEMYFTLPRELTGRSPEAVRCSARVVHVEERSDQRGLSGIGAVVERFESLIARRDWSN